MFFNAKWSKIFKFFYFIFICHVLNLHNCVLIILTNVLSLICSIIHNFKNWRVINQNMILSICWQCMKYDLWISTYFFFWIDLIRNITLFHCLKTFHHFMWIISRHIFQFWKIIVFLFNIHDWWNDDVRFNFYFFFNTFMIVFNFFQIILYFLFYFCIMSFYQIFIQRRFVCVLRSFYKKHFIWNFGNLILKFLFNDVIVCVEIE